MGSNKNWSKEELLYLEENWGTVSKVNIAKHLNRSVTAVTLKAQRIGLGSFLLSGEYITFNELIKTLTGHKSNSYQLESWLKNRDFPIHYKRVNQNRFRVVYLNGFWKWAEKK